MRVVHGELEEGEQVVVDVTGDELGFTVKEPAAVEEGLAALA